MDVAALEHRSRTHDDGSDNYRDIRPVVVTPTFNNADTLINVLTRIEAVGLPLIVVNDGSTDATRNLLALWIVRCPQHSIVVEHHTSNRGKAAALNSGFAVALQAGYTHAVTIDTDGQHDPEDIPALLRVAARDPHALVIGQRRDDSANCPGPNRVGRWFSKLFMQIECGQSFGDTQCGLRIYPLQLVRQVRCRFGGFAFETEIITRAHWAGYRCKQVEVTGRYLPPQQRVSHFRPVLDTLWCIGLHGWLIARALLPWPHRCRGLGHPTSAESVSLRQRLGRIWQWVAPQRAWRELRGTGVERGRLAAGIALGTFIANTPFYGLHSLMSLYAARRLSLHPLSVVVGSQLSTPPLGPLLNVAAIAVGSLVLTGQWPDTEQFRVETLGWMNVISASMVKWWVGSVIVGGACMVTTFFVVLGLLWALPSRHPGTGGASPLEADTAIPIYRS